MADIYKSEPGRRVVEEFYRCVLNRWPVPGEEFVVPTCHGDTFVVASGDRSAPPVVLLHGSGANSGIWIRDVAVWARRYRVYAVDLIGEPGFSAPSRPPLASDAYAAWLDDVWRSLGLAQASIVGVSLGGWVGLDFAVRRPGRVVSLSLLSPSGVGGQNHLTLLGAGVLGMFGEWGLRRSLRLVSGRDDDLPQPVADAILTVFRSFRPRMERVPMRSDAELARLSMPVQVIVGSDDAMLRSSETRERFVRCVPHARVTVLENVGHFLPPQTTAVAEFLDSAV